MFPLQGLLETDFYSIQGVSEHKGEGLFIHVCAAEEQNWETSFLKFDIGKKEKPRPNPSECCVDADVLSTSILVWQCFKCYLWCGGWMATTLQTTFENNLFDILG